MASELADYNGPIGNFGGYDVKVDNQGYVTLTLTGGKIEDNGFDFNVGGRLDIVKLLELAAKQTANTWDDSVIAAVKKALGR